MKTETLLPLGKLDPGLREPDTPLDLSTLADAAAQVEEIGYDAMVVEETKDDPYQVLAVASTKTNTLGLGTSVAMAFPRSPTITAMSAWTTQKLSNGRFVLGLGSQVRGHVRRRFGMEWHPPAPWMRDYVLAVRAVWRCWQQHEPLDYEGEHYRLNLMVPLFDPGPIEHPDIPIQIAAINPNMCAVAGEVADGARLHPVCSPKYIEQIMKPAIAKGAARTNRDPTSIELCMKPLIATAPNRTELERVVRTVRARVAFYLSTPAYRPAFEVHGWTDLAEQATELSRAQRWEDLPDLVDDEMLNTIATVGTHDVIADQMSQRYGDLVQRIEFSIPVHNPDDAAVLSAILDQLGD
ncbi:MAG: TIGR03617 family F420-dependent LLM class oxidoreductase [Actinomycetia bacterium]|nr:TIGR03617 family F420-dependent LLM class oxidoreductase [Actinomycetes bacterium]MCP4961726.1 TIGR03617 family F420-dependent LLM class oxidoreductase [Actinomycetes bacterium]